MSLLKRGAIYVGIKVDLPSCQKVAVAANESML